MTQYFSNLYGVKGWAALGLFGLLFVIVIPALNLFLPESSVLRVPDYALSLIGKIMCYAIVAMAMDLIWGYTGILSLGHGLFFALGGYGRTEAGDWTSTTEAWVLEGDGWREVTRLPAPQGDETPFPLVTDLSPRRFAVTTGGDTFLVTIPEFSADADAALGGNVVKAPMPGKVLSVLATAGKAVTRGETLAVLEAMKMEHALAAPRDGIVEAVHAAAGQQVADGDVLVMLVEE